MKRLLFLALLIASPASAQIITPTPSGFQRLSSNGTSVGNGGDTTEDTLMTFTLAAGQLANVGDTIHIRAGGTLAATTDSKTVRIRLGNLGPVIGSVTTNSASATAWYIDVVLLKTAANAQSYISTGVLNAPVTQGSRVGTATATDTGTLLLQLTGQNSTTASAGSITAQAMIVDYEH